MKAVSTSDHPLDLLRSDVQMRDELTIIGTTIVLLLVPALLGMC